MKQLTWKNNNKCPSHMNGDRNKRGNQRDMGNTRDTAVFPDHRPSG